MTPKHRYSAKQGAAKARQCQVCAHQAREGLFSCADGGTLFLDEIGEMPLTMQAHLAEPDVIKKILEHLGAKHDAQVNHLPESRAPPQLGLFTSE